MKKVLFCVAIVIAFGRVCEGYSRDLYAAMGDSITAGLRAMTSIGGYVDPVLEEAKLPPENRKENVMNRILYSWATGEEIFSQQVLLNIYETRRHHQKIDFENVARSGKKSSNMDDQAQEIVKIVKKRKYENVAYVTLLVGANDVCGDTPDEEFHESLLRAFDTLSQLRQKTPIRMLVLGIPNIADLGTEEINNAHIVKGISCRQIRKMLGIEYGCGQVLDWKTQEEYEEKSRLVSRRNEILKKVVEEANEKFPNMRLVFSNALFDSHPSVDDLAADCFHPNRLGQQKISFAAWSAQPWFK